SEFCQALPPASAMHLRGSDGFAFDYLAGEQERNPRTLQRQFSAAGVSYHLELSAPIGDVAHTLDLLRLLLLSLLPVVIAIAGAGAAWLSGRALKPVKEIAAAARTIGIDNLSQRLPVPPHGDELA